MYNVTVSIYMGGQNKAQKFWYIKGLVPNIEQQVMNNFGANVSKTDRGSLKLTVDPCNVLAQMGITFALDDKTQQNNQAAATGGNQYANNNAGNGANTSEDKVWTYGTSIFVKTIKLKNDQQLKESFKQQFDAIWDKDNKYWVIANSNGAFNEDQVKQYLGMGGAVQQPQQNNNTASVNQYPGSSMVNGAGEMVISKEQLAMFTQMTACLNAGGVVRVGA